MSSSDSPRPKSRIYEFSSGELTVSWDLKRCIHAEECIHGLPKVFDRDRRPWIDPGLADADAVRGVVLSCPTGALHYEDKAGGAPEPTPEANRVRSAVDGPLYLEGDLSIDAGADEELHENRAALCRCGASSNKPFCDNSHLETGFEDDAALAPSRLQEGETDATGLQIRCAPNGPLIVEGPLTLEGAGEQQTGTGGALCRCGASGAKPFCDGSHVAIGFVAD